MPPHRIPSGARAPAAAAVRVRGRHARRALPLAVVAVVLSSGLTGCAWTLITAADATGSVIQAGYAIASNYPSPTFVNGQPAIVREVCIELNPTVSVGDFVPALQLALHRRGVNSDVYNPGTAPANCEATLVYNASVDYGQREFSTTPQQYLSVIDLTLIEQDHIVVTARYQTGTLGIDRFTDASVKLERMIAKMVVDRTTLRPPTFQTSQLD